MPIQIVNSGVKLGSEPNTTTTVVFRNEGGVVSRLSNTLLSGQRKTRHFSHRGSIDASDGGTAVSLASDRHTPLAVAHPGDAEGGNSSSPYDMTSVFGLEVSTRIGSHACCLHVQILCGMQMKRCGGCSRSLDHHGGGGLSRCRGVCELVYMPCLYIADVQSDFALHA